MIPVFADKFGGPVTVVRSVSKELAKKGHEVTVYTTSALDRRCDFKDLPFRIKKDGYAITYFPRIFKFSGFNISPTMATALNKTISEFDIIHLHSWRHFQDIIVCYYAMKHNVPFVLQVHAALSRVTAKRMLKWIYDFSLGCKLLRSASKVIALSKMEAEQYRAMGIPDEKIAVIPNGIDSSEYVNLPPIGSFKRRFGISEEKKVILYLGRIHKTKGIDFLVRAYAHLVKNLKLRDTMLVIAGPDDGYLSKTKYLVSSLGIYNEVLFTGLLTKQEKISAFVDSSFVISPERVNVFLLVPLEAAACGRPVIVSNTNYISHMVREGGFGFSVEYGDVDKLVEVMNKLLNDERLLREMGQKGRKFILKNFSWTAIVTEFERVYEEVLKSMVSTTRS